MDRGNIIIKKIASVIFIALFFLSFFVTLSHLSYPPSVKSDFYIYYKATQDALLHLSVYNKFYVATTPFNYPPNFFAVFLPFVFLPYKTSGIIWNFLSIFLFLWGVILFFRLFLPKTTLPQQLLFGSFLLFTFPVTNTLYFSQNNLIVFFFVMAAFYVLEKKNQQVFAGILIGIAAGFKLLPLVLLLYFILRKKYTAAFSCLITFFSFIIIDSLFGISPNLLIDYILYAKSFAVPKENSLVVKTMLINYDQSLTAFLITYTKISQAIRGLLVYFATIIAICFVIVKWLRKNKKFPKDVLTNNFELFSLLFAITVLLPVTQTWEHHLVFLFPLLFYFFYKTVKKFTIFNCIFLGAVTFLITQSAFDINPILWAIGFGQHAVVVDFHALFALAGALLL